MIICYLYECFSFLQNGGRTISLRVPMFSHSLNHNIGLGSLGRKPNSCSNVRGVEYVGHRCSTAVFLSQESLTPSPSHLPHIDISPAKTPASPLSSTSAPHVIIAHQCAAKLTIQATSSSRICQPRHPSPTRQLRKKYVTVVLF